MPENNESQELPEVTPGGSVPPRPMFSNEEACELLKCSQTTLHYMLATGQLPGMKIGRNWLIPRNAFIEGLNELAWQKTEARRAAAKSAPSTMTISPAPPRRRGPRSRYDQMMDAAAAQAASESVQRPGRSRAIAPQVDWGAVASAAPQKSVLPLPGMSDEMMAATERMFAGLPPLRKAVVKSTKP